MSLTASPKCKLPPIRGLILTKFRKTHTSHGQQVLFYSTPTQTGPCVPSLSLWRGELSWTEAWWEQNPNKTSFLGSHFTFQWDQRGFPPSSKSVCTDLSVAAPICVSVCVVTLRDRMCVCVWLSAFPAHLTQYTPLFIVQPISLPLFLSPSFPFIPFYWSQILILSFVWCPLEKEDVMGDRRF